MTNQLPTLDELLAQKGIDKTEVKILPTGTDLEVFDRSVPWQDLGDEYDCDDESRMIIGVCAEGTLYWYRHETRNFSEGDSLIEEHEFVPNK